MILMRYTQAIGMQSMVKKLQKKICHSLPLCISYFWICISRMAKYLGYMGGLIF